MKTFIVDFKYRTVTLLTLLEFFPQLICFIYYACLNTFALLQPQGFVWAVLRHCWCMCSGIFFSESSLPRAKISSDVGQEGKMFKCFFFFWCCLCNVFTCWFAQLFGRYIPNASSCWGFKGIWSMTTLFKQHVIWGLLCQVDAHSCRTGRLSALFKGRALD